MAKKKKNKRTFVILVLVLSFILSIEYVTPIIGAINVKIPTTKKLNK